MAIDEDIPLFSPFDSLISALRCATDSERIVVPAESDTDEDTFSYKNFFSVRERSKSCYEITSAMNPEELRAYLKDYAKALENDNVTVFDFNDEHLSYNKQLIKFKSTLRKDLSKKDYKITSPTFLAVVLVGYFNKKIDIKSFELEFPSRKEPDDKVPLIKYFQDNEYDLPVFFDDFWDIKIILDVSGIFVSKREVKYTPTEKKVIEEVQKRKKQGKFFISVRRLKELFEQRIENNKVKTAEEVISHEISALNKKYKHYNSNKLLGKKEKETQTHEAMYVIL
ncbi:MAG: hypothetical protein K6C94_06560 [Candidatus Gastranaerophilales bacterium]|nr:hypothetical protein [Candidatus Gastranaerophilales bacterium]